MSSTTPVPLREHRFLPSGINFANSIEDFSNVKVEKRLEEFMPALKCAEPRLVDLELASFAGDPEIFGDLETGRLMPLSFMGEGIRRLLAIVLNVARSRNGVVLIDEIENGLHHSVLERVWRAVGDAARIANCQVFATTHSYECIQAAQRAFADNGEDDLTLVRLERTGGTIEPIVISEESLETAIKHDWEIR